jgi:hypothetical protein
MNKVVNTKDRSIAERFFYGLRPSIESTSEQVEEWEDYLDYLGTKPDEMKEEGDERLKKWVRSTIH